MLNINLEGSPVDPDSLDSGYWVDGQIITERSESCWAVTKLPRANRITMLRIGDGRARLMLGGLSKPSVSVTGPTNVIEALRAEVI